MALERAPISHRVRPAAGTPAGALVLMHGRGADELDLVPLLDLLDPEERLVGILPRGPLALPPGGAHWYIVREIGFPDAPTFLETFADASAWLDAALAEAGVGSEQTVLGGFSQGAVMSYSLGLAASRPRPAGILAMSGFVPTVDGFELDLERSAGLPVSISHGTHDPVIGVAWGRDARERLEAAGAEVSYREDPVAHQIAPGALAQARAVLEAALLG
ncbi:MAG: alpha/beta hydrolase [Gaiellaceae bacterium]